MAKRAVDIVLSGDKELKGLFEDLPQRVRRSGLRQSVSAGLTPINKAVKQNLAPYKRTGTLKKAITRKIKQYPSGTAVGLVGADKGAAVNVPHLGNVVPKNYIHLLERGVKPHHYVKREGEHPGFVGRFPLKRAYDATRSAVQQVMRAKLRQVVERAFAKLKGR